MSSDPTDTKGAAADDAAALVVPDDPRDDPDYSVVLWPNRSLTPVGFRRLLIIVTVGLSVPLVPLLGTPVGWGMLPFLLAALLGLYLAIQRSYRDGTLTETLHLWPDLITVERTEPDGFVRRWQANPFWVNVKLHENARLKHYLTLTGNGREIELGAFLSPEERSTLKDELDDAMRRIVRP